MHPGSVHLRADQVARLQARRKELGLTRQRMIARLEAALRAKGYLQGISAATKRYLRVMHPRQRRPTSELTLLVIALVLGWTLPKLERELGLGDYRVPRKPRLVLLNGRRGKIAPRQVRQKTTRRKTTRRSTK